MPSEQKRLHRVRVARQLRKERFNPKNDLLFRFCLVFEEFSVNFDRIVDCHIVRKRTTAKNEILVSHFSLHYFSSYMHWRIPMQSTREKRQQVKQTFSFYSVIVVCRCSRRLNELFSLSFPCVVENNAIALWERISIASIPTILFGVSILLTHTLRCSLHSFARVILKFNDEENHK